MFTPSWRRLALLSLVTLLLTLTAIVGCSTGGGGGAGEPGITHGNPGETNANGGGGGSAVATTDQDGTALLTVGADTASLTVRDAGDNMPIPDVEVSIDPETRVGLAFDPSGDYLPEWFEGPSGVGKQARVMGAFSLLVRMTKAVLSDATPDPQVVRTTELSGSGVEDFPGVFGLRLPAFYSYTYAGAVQLGELDSLKQLLEEHIAGEIGDHVLAEAVTELGAEAAGGPVGWALTLVSVSLTADEFLLAGYWRDLGYDDDDWFDLYYRTGTPPWGVPVHLVIWPRASAPDDGAESGLAGDWTTVEPSALAGERFLVAHDLSRVIYYAEAAIPELGGSYGPFGPLAASVRDGSLIFAIETAQVARHYFEMRLISADEVTVVETVDYYSDSREDNVLHRTCVRTGSEGSDPFESDFDGDSVPDIDDNCLYVQNPGQEDSDGDGHGDECDDTSSGNGDLDADGIPDDEDGCPNDPNKTSPGDCGCGNPESEGCAPVFWETEPNDDQASANEFWVPAGGAVVLSGSLPCPGNTSTDYFSFQAAAGQHFHVSYSGDSGIAWSIVDHGCCHVGDLYGPEGEVIVETSGRLYVWFSPLQCLPGQVADYSYSLLIKQE